MGARGLLAGIAAFLVGACNPFGGGEYTCTTDPQCGAGRCTNGFCSFVDGTCASGFRYGDLAGPLSNTCVGAEPQNDAGLDAKVWNDAPVPNVKCYGTGLAIACFTSFVPSGQVSLAGTIDTGTSNMCATNVDSSPPWCVIAAATIAVPAGVVRITGTKPLVLIATDTIDITGTLDVSSKRTNPETIGAAADFSGCQAGTPPTAGHGGGGAGGSFGGTGGNGGNGDQNNSKGLAGAAQGATALRGGCPGQNGDGNGGAPGHGGGVLYLIADTSITVTGSIDASGEGGQGGVRPGGGGGGAGAGGLVGLDSPVVTVIGNVFANGGGGGEGAGNVTSDGADGNDPTVTGAGTSNNNSSGGQGGAGGAGMNANGANGSGPDFGGSSGGGGGGSVGVIKLHRATAIGGVGAVSPPHS